LNLSFYSIQENSDHSWCVVKKDFPAFVKETVGNEEVVKFSIASCQLDEKYPDKSTTEIAARKMAELAKLPLVPDDASVITVLPRGQFVAVYMLLELTPSGKVIRQGREFLILADATSEALGIAEKINAIFIPVTDPISHGSPTYFDRAICSKK